MREKRKRGEREEGERERKRDTDLDVFYMTSRSVTGGCYVTSHCVIDMLCDDHVKGTVQRDFSTPGFFTKRLVLVSLDKPKSDFEFCQIFVELFVLKISKY